MSSKFEKVGEQTHKHFLRQVKNAIRFYNVGFSETLGLVSVVACEAQFENELHHDDVQVYSEYTIAAESLREAVMIFARHEHILIKPVMFVEESQDTVDYDHVVWYETCDKYEIRNQEFLQRWLQPG